MTLSTRLDVDLLGYHASFEQKMASKTFHPVRDPQPAGAVLKITPASFQALSGQTVQLASTRSDGKTGHPVTWTLQRAAGDKISSTGLFTAANPAGRSVTVYATDDTGATGVTSVQIGTPFDPVGNLQAT